MKSRSIPDGRQRAVPVTVGSRLPRTFIRWQIPAVDAAGNIFSTFSGGRGQKVPVSVFKVDNNRSMRPFLSDMMNATGLAFDRDGLLYVSSRIEGVVYRVTPDGRPRGLRRGHGRRHRRGL